MLLIRFPGIIIHRHPRYREKIMIRATWPTVSNRFPSLNETVAKRKHYVKRPLTTLRHHFTPPTFKLIILLYMSDYKCIKPFFPFKVDHTIIYIGYV